MSVIRVTGPGATELADSIAPACFQILALDGGGAKGLFTAKVLALLERDLNMNVTDHFNLIAGTSAGGIIALALGAGLRAADIADSFTSLVTSVFPPARQHFKVAQVFHPLYSSRTLRRSLTEVLQGKILGDSIRPLVIPSWDTQSNEVHVFKTRHHERFTRDWRVPMVDVALATSAAPTYFPASRLNGQRLIDGGVWANDPSVVAVAEAVGVFGVPITSVRVLSIGTTTDLRSTPRRLDKGGLVQWATKAVPLVMDATASGGKGVTRFLIGEDNYLRVDALVPAKTYALDAVDLDDIQGRAEAVSRNFSPLVKTKFLQHLAPPFTPISEQGTEDANETH